MQHATSRSCFGDTLRNICATTTPITLGGYNLSVRHSMQHLCNKLAKFMQQREVLWWGVCCINLRTFAQLIQTETKQTVSLFKKFPGHFSLKNSLTTKHIKFLNLFSVKRTFVHIWQTRQRVCQM